MNPQIQIKKLKKQLCSVGAGGNSARKQMGKRGQPGLYDLLLRSRAGPTAQKAAKRSMPTYLNKPSHDERAQQKP